ncbi:TPA: SNF2-related protein [Yersinia enterocolitica]|nr:ATP-dependent helicase [Yersinia enterocolitica]HDW8049943.1 DEAD/DEAH box helicase [Yersinia enterocolitica]HEB0976176.1 DEAD/DEAH box helicase [Yersinia enterocolitica]
MVITDYQAKYFAQELIIRHAENGVDQLSQSLFDASIDLNPHQIHAALFALNNPLSKGVVLADEVGLGKTIEAGLVLSQYWAERKRKILIICPASLRRQWVEELTEKFNLSAQVLDAKTWRMSVSLGQSNPLASKCIKVMSYHYAARMESQLMLEHWDIVVLDEAHKLRNAHRSSNKMGQNLRRVLEGRKKLLLTATPLQNSLMELFGLSTIIDEQIFGDEHSFKQQFINKESSLSHLKQRLSGFIQRTLRKDVLEYVRYTQRQTLTVPFTPSATEMALYEGISAFLEKEESYALPKNQRHLTGLILRKLLASSSHAVSSTLETIKRRLIDLKFQVGPGQDLINELVEIDDLGEEYTEYLDDSVNSEIIQPVDLTLLNTEITELKHYIEQAKSISTDSKTQALLTALTQGFQKMEAMGAPRKAIIFTESKRTQEYLARFLVANGFADKLVTFSGSNNHQDATKIYQQWLFENQGSDKVSGSPQIDRRSSLIDYFRYHAEVMIATEAAAEGVNLQFCSLLINYDLPWNPQRVEQRIGRCHRYGQQYDVVVINFLNESNKADQRVLELLTEKFHLFEGVFGASDNMLGSIESGIDFEKRIQHIYESCRHPVDINAAFDQLQKELEADINHKMCETQKLLLENFDEDIHDLLKIQLDAAQQRLDKVGRWFWQLSCHELANKASIDLHRHSFQLTESLNSAPTGLYQLVRRGSQGHNYETDKLSHAYIYRITHPLGEWVIERALERELSPATLTFDYSAHQTKISMLEPFVNQSGVLSLQKFSIESLERCEDHLLFAALDEYGNPIPSEVAQKLMQLSASVHQQITRVDFDSQFSDYEIKLCEILEKSRLTIEKQVNDRNLSFFEQEVSKLDAWADDLKEGLEQSIKELDKQIKQVRREAKIAPTLEEKLSLQKQQRHLENLRNKSRRELFDKQDEVDGKRESFIESLEGKLNKKTSLETLFRIGWKIV